MKLKMKSKVVKENYLDITFKRCGGLTWSEDDNGCVVLEKENTGLANRIAQLLIKKPKTSYIHLDEIGSFIWKAIDGKKSVSEIGQCVKEHFGEAAEPLYDRLVQYMIILDSNDFVERA